MIKHRIEYKKTFTVSGVKTRISGQNNEEFARFWEECNSNGISELLRSASADPAINQTHSRIMGISRVENDPANRAFDFYIASEAERVDRCESFEIMGGEWAIFEGDGNDPMALIRAETEAFMNWLPASGYIHDKRPEIEVYPEGTGIYVEFWLPIKKLNKERSRMEYRELLPGEADRISEIDAWCYIKKAWRYDIVSKKYKLVEINWTDKELPNGYEWHLQRFIELVAAGGKAFGCFDKGKLVGYGTVGAVVFGASQKYILLDQLFVSKDYRNMHIGSELLRMCASAAKNMGAKKLYLCAGSSEDTIAFYKKNGCVPAEETDRILMEEDPNDIQLELLID